jgi:CheY-like chemotaxis protein
VVPAESGSQALKMLVESPPDLIISDILMEEMDGFEFQRRVSALTNDSIPLIFLTAKGDLQDRLGGLRGGADDYITKPFEPEELEARIQAIMHRVDQTRREARRDTDRLRARIMGEVSSRLRAPVTSLMAHVNLLLSERFGDNTEDEARYLRSALEDAGVLRDLISDLSWAAADAASEPALKRESIRVAPVVRGAAATAAKVAQEKDIQLHISCGGLLSGTIDGTAMTRALASLLESTVELSPEGSRVAISASRAREGGLEFVITDGGGGAHSSGNGSSGADVLDQFDFARGVVHGHGGRVSTRQEDDDRHSLVIWVPGRVAKHIGKRR